MTTSDACNGSAYRSTGDCTNRAQHEFDANDLIECSQHSAGSADENKEDEKNLRILGLLRYQITLHVFGLQPICFCVTNRSLIDTSNWRESKGLSAG